MRLILFVRAFAWMRWRQLVNGLRGAKRRDSLERISRVTALVVPMVLSVVILGTTSALAVVALACGWLVGSGAWPAGPALFTSRALLFMILVVVVLVQLGRSASSVASSHTRLLLLPIPPSALHLVEVVVGLADPWVAPVIPALFLFAVGLLASARIVASVVALITALAFAAVLAFLGSLVSLSMDWLMRNRRRGEVFTLLFVLVISVVGMVPALLGDRLEQRGREAKARGQRPASLTIERLEAALPAWTRAIPSELHGRAIESALGGRSGGAWLGAMILALEAAALYGISAAIHRRLLGTVGSGGGRRRGARSRIRLLRLPGLSPAACAIAAAQARTALRSVRGRLVVIMPAVLVVVFGLLSRFTREAAPGGSFLGTNGHALLGAGIVFSLYALQTFTMNQFASDRAGLTLQLLAPVPDADLVKGKALGCALFFGATVLLCLLGALAVAPGGPPLAWLSVLVGGAAVYLTLSPIAALLSALLPVASDLSKTGSGGNPHGLAMLIGTVLVAMAAAPPGVIIGLSTHAFDRPGVGLLLTALWTLLVAVIAVPLLALVARAIAPRRENLALVAGGK